MTRIVPHQNAFDIARKMEKWQARMLLVSTITTILAIALTAIKEKPGIKYIDTWLIVVNVATTIFAVAFVVLDILVNDRFYAGGREKRIDLIDHAFGTNFSGQKSTGYFNPGNSHVGVYKLGVLGFENSLFTSTVAKKMAWGNWITTIVISIIFIVSACTGNKDLVTNLFQLAAPAVLIQQAIKLQTFSNRMSIIHAEFKTLFNSLKGVQTLSDGQQGEIIKNVLNYEATHAWGSILLNSAMFDKMNVEISAKWSQMKQDYSI